MRAAGSYQGVAHVGTYTTHNLSIPYVTSSTPTQGLAELLGFVLPEFNVGDSRRYVNLHYSKANDVFYAPFRANIDKASTLIIGTDLCTGAVTSDGSSGLHGLATFPISHKSIGDHISYQPFQLIKMRCPIDGVRVTRFRVFLTDGHGKVVDLADEVYICCLVIEW